MATQVLVFGGSFNPPTLAHEAIIRACLDLVQFDEVWVMPSGERLDKNIGVSDAHRLVMLERVRTEQFASDPRLRISDFELRLPRPTNTYDTVRALTASYPGTEFWFAYGTDAYLSMSQWQHGARLQKILKCIVFARNNDQGFKGTGVLQVQLPDLVQAVSSTQVRSAIGSAAPVEQMLSAAVARYIAQHHLYFDR